MESTSGLSICPKNWRAMTRRKVSPEVNALSAIIFVVVLTILLIVNVIDIKKHEKEARR